METHREDLPLSYALGRIVGFAQRIDREYQWRLSGLCYKVLSNPANAKVWCNWLIIRLAERVIKSRSKKLNDDLMDLMSDIDSIALANIPAVLPVEDRNSLILGYFSGLSGERRVRGYGILGRWRTSQEWLEANALVA